MAKTTFKAALAVGLLLLLGPLNAKAAEPFILDSLSAENLRDLKLPIPKANAFLENINSPSFGTIALQDESLTDSLTPAQWNEVFGAGQEAGAEWQDLSKELLSDFTARYVINGTLQLENVPPTFTTLTGKVYTVVKYPKWLKNCNGRAKLDQFLG